MASSSSVTLHRRNKICTPAALARYVGRSGTIRTSGPNSMDAVSGATATSKAITAGVNRALNIVANLDTSEEINYEDTQ